MTSAARSRRRVFGPVPSRRLGRSLGVDLVPYKTCSYDCIYCQLGATTCRTIERGEWVPVDEILADLDTALAGRPAPDYITLSGSGEPTLHCGLGAVVAGLRERTDRPIAVLTNGSLLGDPAVRADLRGADVVMPSLDVPDEALFTYVNRPHPSIGFATMVGGLRAFRNDFAGRYWLEVLLLAGVTAIEAEVEKLAALVADIAPDLVQLTTALRPPAEPYAHAAATERLEELARCFACPVDVVGPYTHGTELLQDATAGAGAGRGQAAAVLEFIRRRPGTIADIAGGLGLAAPHVAKVVAALSADGVCQTEIRHGAVHYLVRPRTTEQGGT